MKIRGERLTRVVSLRRSIASIAHADIFAGGIADRRQGTFARLARRHFLLALARDPFDPVGPPASLVFDCAIEPILKFTRGRFAEPILIFWLGCRIDDARDMAGARKHKADLAAQKLGADEDGFRRGDMILARRHMVDGYGDALPL
jgi:hypothetical protein